MIFKQIFDELSPSEHSKETGPTYKIPITVCKKIYHGDCRSNSKAHSLSINNTTSFALLDVRTVFHGASLSLQEGTGNVH